MGITTYEQATADKVFDATLALSEAIRKAAAAGLTIEQTGKDFYGAPIIHVRKEAEIFKTPPK